MKFYLGMGTGQNGDCFYTKVVRPQANKMRSAQAANKFRFQSGVGGDTPQKKIVNF
jgi:hypothetical protein